MYQIFFKLKSSILILLLCGATVLALGQSSAEIDSLETQLSDTKGIDRYNTLYAVAVALVDVDNNKALSYIAEASELSVSLGDSLKMVMSARVQAQILRRLDDLNGAIEIFDRILPIAKRNGFIEEQKRILNALAVAHTFRAEYDQALQYNFQSLVIREKEGRKEEVSVTLNNIGLIYFKLKNYATAIGYYERALKLRVESNSLFDLDRLMINIGLCYNQLDKYDKAREYIQSGLDKCKDNCNDLIFMEGKFGLGVSYYREAEITHANDIYVTAETFFRESFDKAKAKDDKRWSLENLTYLSRIYTRINALDKAQASLTEAEAIVRNTEYHLLQKEIYKGFSDLYNMTQNYQKAAFYQGLYISLNDSINSEALIENLSKIQADFAERENIATIAAKEEVIKQQRDLNIAVAVIAILAGLLVLVLQRSNRTIKRVNAQLSEAKEIIEEQNKLLESKNKFLDKEVEIKTEDLERVNQSLKQVNDELDNFIYKTSHDIRGPLASLKGMCNVALMDVKDVVALDYLRKLDTTAERLNTILTRLLIINQINNSKLTVVRVDFDSIISDVLLLEKKKGLPQKLKISKHVNSTQHILSDKELIRIVLENLIDNAIKYYNESDRVDSFVSIHVDNASDDQVSVRVIDNGIGISEANPGKLFRMFFRASERSETGGIGLYIVKTATAKLGGKVGLQTTPEGYTEFYVTFPAIPPKQDEDEKPSI